MGSTLGDISHATWFDNVQIESNWALRSRNDSVMSLSFKSRMTVSGDQAGTSNWKAQGNIFCSNNIALYGPCVASSSQNIQLEYVSTQNGVVFPGLSFQINVAKKDFYNQTITTDSSTLLQIQASKGKST